MILVPAILQVFESPVSEVDEPVRFAAPAVAETQLTWDNYQSELIRVQNLNAIPDAQFNAMSNFVFFDATTFNLADGAALNTALTNETLTIADLETHASNYTIT